MISRKERKRRDLETARLQRSLAILLRFGGWGEKKFGEKLDVSKQTISNWITKKTKMTYLQYIAIRAVLDSEIEADPDNTMLAKAVTLLLDAGEEVNEDEFAEHLELMDYLSVRAKNGIKNKNLESSFLKLAPALGAAAALTPGGAIIAGAYWLMKDKKRENDETEDCFPDKKTNV